VTLRAIADEGKSVILEVFLARLSAYHAIETDFGAIEAEFNLQEASLLASQHALFAR
jgi:hypothetical protein